MRRALLPLVALLAGCSADPGPEQIEEPAPTVMVISQLGFAREEPDGVSLGFDLDERVSDADDAQGCGVVDLTHPITGATGIDNAFAGLLPALEQAGAGPLEDLIQASVDSGELLIALEMKNLQAPVDGCVDLTLLRADGPPALGEDEILPGQTYERNLVIPQSSIPCATLSGDVLSGRDFALRLQLNVFDEFIDLTLLEAQMELDMSEEGRAYGIIGGGISVLEVEQNVAGLDGIGDQIPQLIGPLLDANADLEPTGFGSCQRLSVQMKFEAINAFLFD